MIPENLLSQDTIHFWSWIVQREYKRTIEDSTHLPEAVRPYYEIQLIHRLNELNYFFLDRSLASQIRLNKSANQCSSNLPDPAERYGSFYDFASRDFSEGRLRLIIRQQSCLDLIQFKTEKAAGWFVRLYDDSQIGITQHPTCLGFTNQLTEEQWAKIIDSELDNDYDYSQEKTVYWRNYRNYESESFSFDNAVDSGKSLVKKSFIDADMNGLDIYEQYEQEPERWLVLMKGGNE